jgi:hypothetical protein
MKRILFLLAVSVCILQVNAQTKQNDSIPKRTDTVKVGPITIVIKKKDGGKAKEVTIIDNDDSTATDVKKTVKFERKKKNEKVSTNWFGLDLGFNNYTDNTNYASVGSYLHAAGTQGRPNASDFKLRTGKSIGANIWIIKQKFNIVKNYWGIKYGLGIEHSNFRYDANISFKKGNPDHIIRDSVDFSKNKLGINYLSVPLEFYFNPDGKKLFSFSAGITAGYKLNSFNKQKSGSRGKDKNRGEFELNPFKLAVTGDIGFKGLRLYGSYGLTNLFDKSSGMDFQPYTIGLRLSAW